MENNVQKEEGLSLLDIFRLLLSKIKLLILVVIIGGFVGGAISVWKTKDVKYYGTRITFYVNPKNPTSTGGNSLNTSGSQFGVYGAYGQHVMDNMVKLLNEDIFAEQLILRSQSLTNAPEGTDVNVYKYIPVPVDGIDELSTALNGAIANATEPVNAILTSEDALKTAQTDYYASVEDYNDKMVALEKAWDDHVNPLSNFNEKEYEELASVPEEVKTALSNMIASKQTSESLLISVNAKVSALEDAKEDAKPYINDTLKLWRKTPNYRSLHARYSSAIHFSFLSANESLEDANNFARSFIYANISVLGDENKKFAENLLDLIYEAVPEYVAENMAVPSGYTGTNCVATSTMESIHQTNSGYTRSQAIKMAILLAAISGVVACIVIIVLDRSDKRLRDYDVLTREFHVPILGVVPTIEMPEHDDSAKKTTSANKQNKEEN
ncbi:MAG: hypothetical protein IJV83_05505 [Clostridia bacterium]|nr:hypothetical protein [Clostridia bacterium]MBQ9714759.1 hypothetical protein [Clostridia bacterium]